VIDFEIPKAYGLRQTIADTLGVGGIMRGLRTVPHLWAVAQDMTELCPQALLLQYVNPMAINTWALAERFRASSRWASAIRCRTRSRNWPMTSTCPQPRSTTAWPG
jgi:alpha-galactosidase/6-phospho-beta-glucosidase family protein